MRGYLSSQVLAQIGAGVAILATFAAVQVAQARQNQQALAQSGEKPSFDVASVRERPKGAELSGPVGVQVFPGRIIAECASLQALLSYAYHLSGAVPLSGLPKWGNAACGYLAGTDTYSVEATMPENTTDEQARQMMQSLLEERFKLKAHWEKKEMALMDLVVRDGGFKLKPVDEKNEAPAPPHSIGCPPDDPRCHMYIGTGTLSILAAGLSPIVGKPVLDKTGVTGTYKLNMFWASDSAMSSSLPSLPGALKDTFNLELKPGNGQVDCLVIDHVEKPSAN
jgi:uncharacterized protein (TIGR03435 family)